MHTHYRHYAWIVIIAVFALVASWVNHGRADAPAGRYGPAINGTVYDTKTKLTWQQVLSADFYTWANAESYCKNLSLNGATWRVPSINELQTVVDRGRHGPAIDPVAFPMTPSVSFWTSSSLAGFPSKMWSVEFDNGTTFGADLTYLAPVRCVY